MSKRRKGYPSETKVKRGLRIVHGNKELSEKLGRNDLCPCNSGKLFKKCCLKKGCFRRGEPEPLLLGNEYLTSPRHSGAELSPLVRRFIAFDPTRFEYNSSMRILFLHGWQSTPGGVKPTFLKEHGHDVINPALPHDDFAEAVRIAQSQFDQHRPQVVVGSSRGGAVAMNIESDQAKLVLLCPAWKKYGMATSVKPGTVILHSRLDEVIPFADSKELVGNSGLPAAALVEVGIDHRLADTEPLQRMLAACEDVPTGNPA